MRIRHLIHGVHNRSAGPTYSVGYLAEQLAANGDDTEVVSIGPAPHDWRFKVGLKNFETPGLLGFPRFSLAYVNYLKQLDQQASIIHGHGVWRGTNLFPFMVKRTPEVRFVCSPRGMLSPWSMNHKRLRKMPFWKTLQRPALERIDCFHVTAGIELEDIRRLGFQQPALIIPNGIVIPLLCQGPRKKQVLFLSRINPKKGLELLLEAWQSVSGHYPDWRLVIAGGLDSNYARGIQRQAEKMALSRCEFVGAVHDADKQQLLDESSLFVLPSYSENFGIVVAEALASAVPVITTNKTPWLNLQDRGCGWTISPDAGQLQAAFSQAMQLPKENLLEMGCKGRYWMQDKFSWTQVAGNMREGYERLLLDARFTELDFS